MTLALALACLALVLVMPTRAVVLPLPVNCAVTSPDRDPVQARRIEARMLWHPATNPRPDPRHMTPAAFLAFAALFLIAAVARRPLEPLPARKGQGT